MQQGLQQLLVVTVMESDRRLVQDVEHPHQLRADLRGEADPLRFAAGEGARSAVQRQVAEPDVIEEAKPLADLLQDLSRDLLLALGPRHPLDHRQPRPDRQPGPAVDVPLADPHRQALRLEPRPAAFGARFRAHELLDPRPHLVRLRLAVAAGQVRDDPLETGPPADLAPLAAMTHLDLGSFAAMQQDPLLLRRQAPERSIEGEPVLLRHRLQHRPMPARLGVPPDRQGTLADRGRWIDHDEVLVELQQTAESLAVRAGAIGAVERKVARMERIEREAAVGAGRLLAEELLVSPLGDDPHQPLTGRERRLQRVGQPLATRRIDRDPVYHDLDDMLALLVQRRRLLVQRVNVAVDADAEKTLSLEPFQILAVLPLPPLDQRGQDLRPLPGVELEDPGDDLVDRLARDRTPALVAMLPPDPREKQAQVVVDLGRCGDGRARIPRGAALFDRDGRRETRDVVDVRLLHLTEELPRVGGERFDVAPLTLGVERVESEGRLARAGDSGQHDERIAGEGDRDVLEVVFAGAFDPNRRLQGGILSVRADPCVRCYRPSPRRPRAGRIPQVRDSGESPRAAAFTRTGAPRPDRAVRPGRRDTSRRRFRPRRRSRAPARSPPASRPEGL